MNDLFGAKKRMYDDLEKYAGDKAADMSQPLQKFRGAVPIAQESVTVLAKPTGKMSPEELRRHMVDKGMMPDFQKAAAETEEAGAADADAIRRALEDLSTDKDEPRKPPRMAVR